MSDDASADPLPPASGGPSRTTTGAAASPTTTAAAARDGVHDTEATHVLGELAIEAAGIGTFDWDLDRGVLTWDDRLISLFGYDRTTFDRTIAGFNAAVHPHDLPRVTHALETAISSCGEYDAEYRIVLPGGETRWVAARGRALCDEDGTARRVLGAAYDSTATRETQARVARVLEAMPTAFYSVDRDWRFTYVNAEAERLLSRHRDELLGGVIWDLFPAALGSDFEHHYRGAMDSGRPVTFDAYYPEPLDGWFQLQAWPGPDGLSVYFLDITVHRRQQHEAEQAAARAALMAQVTTELTETLGGEEAVVRLSRLLVPTLADWCIVTLVDDDEQAGARRGLRDVAWWHADPAQRELFDTYARQRLDALHESSFVEEALRTGRPVTVTTDAAQRVAAVLRPGTARDTLLALDPASVCVLPLRGRGGPVGVVTIGNGQSSGPVSDEDLATTQEVAGRAGLALDNSRLYRQQRRLAEGLQRSMLTAPPEPDHVEIVVRYEPAAQAAQVGGDWYDAFLQRSGATVLVIGDVVGHDVAAAASMGQIRSLLRGIAVATGVGPAGLLEEVDQAMRTLQTDTIATAVVARIEQTPEERVSGVTHLRWANAGHPPPMVVGADGTVTVLAGRPDPLLGVLPDVRRVESEATLERGTTVLLYTDGLVERRERSLVDGMDALREVLVELAPRHLGLDALCDAILARLLPDRPEDDVALVAVRLHPQDRPRPPEAGPNRVPPDVPPDPDADEPG